ncbi:MAG: hypothetical protein IRY93_08575 [Chthoniobacterales bacterium]|nr:hypothetical protein [Chthoniobacterales bacterium]
MERQSVTLGIVAWHGRVKEFDYFKAWLLFFLIATIGAGLAGLIVGSVLAAFLGAAGMPTAQMTRVLQIVGFLIGIPISYGTFRAVIGKYLLSKLWEDDDFHGE